MSIKDSKILSNLVSTTAASYANLSTDALLLDNLTNANSDGKFVDNETQAKSFIEE